MTDGPAIGKPISAFQANLALACLSVIFFSILSYALLLGAAQVEYLIGGGEGRVGFAILSLWVIWLSTTALSIFFPSSRRLSIFLGAAFTLFGSLLIMLVML
jgi:hypothetical protein